MLMSYSSSITYPFAIALTYKSLLANLSQESLKYRLLGSEGDIGSWGHEYVR